MSFVCLELFSRITVSTTYPGIEVRLTSLKFLRSSFFPCLKIGGAFVAFYSCLTQDKSRIGHPG